MVRLGKLDSISTITLVRDRKEPAERQRRDNPQDKNAKEDQPEVEVTDESVNAAIHVFNQGSQAVQVEQEGFGPGLKILMRDPTGVIIRKLTGEEFLKLRDKAEEARTVAGKVLDLKA